MAKWLLIDSYNMVFRAFYAIPGLARSDGFPTNAVHGWLRTLWKLRDNEQPDEMIAVFDLGDDPTKQELLPDYKAQRTEMPEELKKQIPVIKDLTRLLGVALTEVAEVEADDVIGTYAKTFAAKGDEAFIVSADKDLAQCVTDGVSMLLPPPTANPRLGWRKMDEAAVVEKFGVPPRLIPEYLALVGDTVDNIPGIAGVGPKTAAGWLKKFGSLNGILNHTGVLKPERFRQKLEDNRETLARNLQLTTLNTAVEMPAWEKQPLDRGGLFDLLEKMEMRSHLAEARKRYPE